MRRSLEEKRPFTVTIVLWACFVCGLWNVGRTFALAQQVSLSLSLNMAPDPRLRLLMACLWMLLFWGVAVALWRKRPSTRRAIPILTTVYGLYELSLLALYTQVPLGPWGWIGRTLVYATAALLAYWALNRTAAKGYFPEEGSEIRD